MSVEVVEKLLKEMHDAKNVVDVLKQLLTDAEQQLKVRQRELEQVIHASNRARHERSEQPGMVAQCRAKGAIFAANLTPEQVKGNEEWVKQRRAEIAATYPPESVSVTGKSGAVVT